MRSVTAGASEPTSIVSSLRRQDIAAHLVVTASIFMNFGLAIINAHLFSVNKTIVSGCQIFIIAVAVAVTLNGKLIIADRLIYIISIVVAAILTTMLYTGDIDLKFIHDIFIFPIFIALGATVSKISLRWFTAILIIIVAVALIDKYLPELYKYIVNPLSYYAKTRDWALLTAKQQLGSLSNLSGLYVGAERSVGTYLGVGTHRSGSIFLEPLSLSYFAVLFMIYLLEVRGRSLLQNLFYILLCSTLCVLSDTRTALVVLLLIVMLRPMLQIIPGRVVLVWPLILIALIVIALALGNLDMRNFDLGYRLSLTIDPLIDNGLVHVFMGGFKNAIFGDSGVLYLLNGCGIVGTIAIYVLITRGMRGTDCNALSHSVGIFIVVAAIFGSAFLSIKTVSFAGLIIGHFTKLQSSQSNGKRGASVVKV